MKKCDWELVFDENDVHYTSECGGEWFFFEGTREENHMNLCPFCGDPIHEKELIA